ncbi:MAG: proline dehydrogenase family protein, partial [Nitrospiraceae bacterium]|nr:proline dehydrogenase family protein [Nitrospiraceae bacterium]
EGARTAADAHRYYEAYLAALDAVARWGRGAPNERRPGISVKLSALHPRYEAVSRARVVDELAPRLRELTRRARAHSLHLTVDAEEADRLELSLDVIAAALAGEDLRGWSGFGLAVQAYQKRASQVIDWVRDAACALDARLTVRLVKGAYWDSEVIRARQRGWPEPVFRSKADTDANYEALTRLLLRHTDHVRPAFGTHNLRSVAHAEAAAQATGLPPEAYEFQMIFGMAEPLQMAVSQMGRRVRLYTPIGQLLPGMAYLVRRLLENTSNESFLRKEYSGSEPLDRLLAAPSADSSTFSLNDNGDHIGHVETSVQFRNEPHTDFSQASARAAMSEAIAQVKDRLGRTFSSVFSSGRSSSRLELLSRNPSAPSQVIGRLQACEPSDVSKAVEAALGKGQEWDALPAADRVRILRKAAAAMRKRRFELAAWEIFETGKPWREADADIAEAIDFLEFYAQDMNRLGRPLRLGHEPGEVNHLLYAPRGVAAVIAPWNFPLAIPTGMVSAALVTGNVVLFKPSERALVMGALLTQLLMEAGVPEGVLQTLPGGLRSDRRWSRIRTSA